MYVYVDVYIRMYGGGEGSVPLGFPERVAPVGFKRSLFPLPPHHTRLSPP